MGRTVIAIEARIPDPATVGGVAQVIMSLADGLSRLQDGDEEYVFIGTEESRSWLGKRISGPCRLHVVARGYKERLLQSSIGPVLLSARELFRAARSSIKPPGNRSGVAIARSDGVAESLGAKLIHFVTQRAYMTDRASIYHPHDLQHVHMPDFFDAKTLRWRQQNYPVFCQRAKVVAVESTWTKNDVIANLNVPEDKVIIVPMPPPMVSTSSADSSNADLSTFVQLPSRFILYPAQTWPHKNHLRLIDALAILKSEFGLVVPLVATGRQNEFYTTIAARVSEARLGDQIRFLGYVDDARLTALYRSAVAVVVPTRFESLSLPIWEAFAIGTPVACSRVTSLPEQLGGAGVLFDPDDPKDMALAIMKLWQDDRLRQDCVAKGAARLRDFSWDRTARHFRAIYRRTVGSELTGEDEQLLSAPAII
jgi:glycosyltransferase involved in cell wall biosynthesis